jgi:hypothetical protein
LVHVNPRTDQLCCWSNNAGVSAKTVERWLIGMSAMDHTRNSTVGLRRDIGPILSGNLICGVAQNDNLGLRKNTFQKKGAGVFVLLDLIVSQHPR